jgi:hypothetical protein
MDAVVAEPVLEPVHDRGGRLREHGVPAEVEDGSEEAVVSAVRGPRDGEDAGPPAEVPAVGDAPTERTVGQASVERLRPGEQTELPSSHGGEDGVR